jgi:hypothetical protein
MIDLPPYEVKDPRYFIGYIVDRRAAFLTSLGLFRNKNPYCRLNHLDAINTWQPNVYTHPIFRKV